MYHLRSERVAAALLLVAAVTGLVLANLPVGPGLLAWRDTKVGVPGLTLSVGHWVSDGLLAVFFTLVAVELKREVAIGELRTVRRAVVPAVAALGGVIVPALVFLAFTAGSPYANGWPIPTATDVAFALGVLAVFGRRLPTRVRIFLLALAVVDDLIAILLIAILFTDSVHFGALALAGVGLVAFGALGRVLRSRSEYRKARLPRWPIAVVLIALAVFVWVCTVQSGIHPTLAGVALGLVMPRQPAARVAHVLEPWSNILVLPTFAFVTALVMVPAVPLSALSPSFWGIVVALPAGKFVGITLAGWLAATVARRQGERVLEAAEIAAVAALGGIGFTVSLLMNSLAHAGWIADEGTIAVLLGSAVAALLAAVVVGSQSRRLRTRAG